MATFLETNAELQRERKEDKLSSGNWNIFRFKLLLI